MRQIDRIPDTWVKIEIGSLAEVVGGGTPKASDDENFAAPGQGISWITPADLSRHEKKFIDGGRRDLSIKGLEGSSAKLMPKGAVLFSSRAPIGYVAVAESEIATNQGFKSFVFPAEINSSYVYYYLKSIKDIAESLGTGTTFKELSGNKAKQLPFVLAPINEQTRIANKLDSLLAKVQETQARLDKTPSILKRFRQSVLAAATSGELTKEWRGQHEVFGVRNQIIDYEFKIPDKKAKELSEKEFLQADIATPIPESWSWVRLCKISEVVSGLAKGGNKNKETVSLPYLRVANVQRGYLELDEVKEIDIPIDRVDKLTLKYGDILFNEGGDLDKLGRGWIWENQIDNCVHQNHVFRARLFNPVFQPKYISYFGNSAGMDYFIRAGSQTVNLANINKTSLSLLPIALPPADEQKEIVRRVESLFTLADQVEQQYQQAKQGVDRLTQSLLAKAFRGELVPQDPNDEPAAELLKRIQAERQQQEEQAKAQKKRSPQSAAKAKKKTKVQKVQEMKLQDAPDNYLSLLIQKMGGEVHADRLWQQSQMLIDDFYSQLKQEVSSNNILENKSSSDPEQRFLRVAS